MATITPTRISHGHDVAAELYEWASMSNGDTIAWLTLPIKADKVVHVYGTFGGSVAIEGSLETGTPANAVTLNDSRGEGNPLTFTANDIRTVLEPVLQIRPNPGAGVTNTTVRLLAVRP